MPEHRSEFDFESIEAAMTTRQRTDFTADRSALVDDWLSGKLPLDQAAAAMRARIQKLPPSRRGGTASAKTKSAMPAEAPDTV